MNERMAFMDVERIFKALGCKWRIEIIKQIAKQSQCMCDLEVSNHIDKTTLSRHMSILQNAGIVDLQREGQKKRIVLKDFRVLELIDLAQQIAKNRE